MEMLLAPPVAFLAYIALVGFLSGAGRVLAGPSRRSPLKSDVYASGEAPPTRLAAPGYGPFFAVALFFAMLHLGVLVVGSGDLSPASGLYLIGLALVLVTLVVG
jgi:NADH:ubiquinone oxidoreductase subunit 3 (subunit A)